MKLVQEKLKHTFLNIFNLTMSLMAYFLFNIKYNQDSSQYTKYQNMRENSKGHKTKFCADYEQMNGLLQYPNTKL